MTIPNAAAPNATSQELLQRLGEWLRDTPGLHSEQFVQTQGMDDALLEGDIACGEALLSLFVRTASASVQAGGAVHIECRQIPIGAEIGIRFQPTPAFALFLKQYMDDGDMEPAQSAIPTMPDALVALFISRRIADAFGVRTLFQIDQHKNAALFAFLKKPAAAARPARAQPEVLIIEDTSPIGMLVELYLRQGGFKTTLATDSLRGLNLARERHPDLVTLDVMMPGLDGWQVLRSLKEDDTTAGIPVIIVSVLKDKQVGFSIGASEYLQKPVVEEELVRLARRLTTPAPEPARRISDDPRRIVLFTESGDLSGRLSAAFESHAFRVSPFDPKGLETLTSGSAAPPNVAILDFQGSYLAALSLLQRFRLFRSLDAIPLIGLADTSVAARLRFESHGLLDGILHPAAVDTARIRAALAEH